jgi:4-hydroxy-tetrahydrodipicolinate reductase
MGREVVRAVSGEDDMYVSGAVDTSHVGEDAGQVAGLDPLSLRIADSVDAALAEGAPDVAVDFTLPDAVMGNLRALIGTRVPCVVGTSGLTQDDLRELESLCEREGVPALCAPNFAIGAVLMMEFAAQAAKHFGSAEIIELHHAGKVDAPSATARRTAQAMADSPGSLFKGARSSDERSARGEPDGAIHIHSVRLPGLVAHQEVIFGGAGQTLTIRHDSTSRESFMPGVLLAIRKIRGLSGLAVGLERIL